MNVITIRTPDDLLAAVPSMLGFHPTDSLVMVPIAGVQKFTARVGLPQLGAVGETVDMLMEPAKQHGLTSVVLVLYAPRYQEYRVDATLNLMLSELSLAGIEVKMAVWYAEPYFAVHFGDDWSEWTPAAGSPLSVELAVDHGMAPFNSREALGASIEGILTSTEEERMVEEIILARLGVTTDGDVDQQWVRDLVTSHMASGERVERHHVIRLLACLRHPELRDQAWGMVNEDNARSAVDFWVPIVREAPSEYVADAAAVLAFCAWANGQGALGWVAVDRATEVEPDHSLASIVTSLLANAVPPSFISEIREVTGS